MHILIIEVKILNDQVEEHCNWHGAMVHGPQRVFLNGFKSRKLVLNTGLLQGRATDNKDSMESLVQNKVPETKHQLLYSEESKWNSWRALSTWGHKWTHGCPSKYTKPSQNLRMFKFSKDIRMIVTHWIHSHLQYHILIKLFPLPNRREKYRTS